MHKKRFSLLLTSKHCYFGLNETYCLCFHIDNQKRVLGRTPSQSIRTVVSLHPLFDQFFISHASCPPPPPPPGSPEIAVAVIINGLWRSCVLIIPLPARYWWALQLHAPPPPPVSKLVSSDPLPAHAKMQIPQQRSFISNQTRAAARHPGSSVPTELLFLSGSD